MTSPSGLAVAAGGREVLAVHARTRATRLRHARHLPPGAQVVLGKILGDRHAGQFDGEKAVLRLDEDTQVGEGGRASVVDAVLGGVSPGAWLACGTCGVTRSPASWSNPIPCSCSNRAHLIRSPFGVPYGCGRTRREPPERRSREGICAPCIGNSSVGSNDPPCAGATDVQQRAATMSASTPEPAPPR